MKFGDVVVHIEYYNFTKFHYILMKKIIVLYQTNLTDGLSVRGRWIVHKKSFCLKKLWNEKKNFTRKKIVI